MDEGLTWSQAMAWTHLEHGVRAEEHFATSIDVGDEIAHVVLRRCADAAARHGIARPWIVDVGAGSGLLLRQLLELGFPRDRLLGVDVRPGPADLPWIQAVAPDCLPRVAGLVFAHEFLDDVPADIVRDGHVERLDGSSGPAASSEQLAWARRWGEGVNGTTRDNAWARIVASVSVGEAIAVDFPGGGPVGHRHGRRTPAVVDGRDICAGVEFRSLRDRTGGRIVPQHRLVTDPVLADKAGLGAFLWLITDVPG